MKELSRRHHYLPQFYLKGFVNEKKTFGVYDKHKKKLKHGEFSPKTHFFEDGRNTVEVNGKMDDFIESVLYQKIDNDLAPTFEKIHKANGNFLSVENLFQLKSFIAFLYWRVPKNDLLLEKLTQVLDFSQIGFLIKDKATGKTITKEEEDRFRKDPAFVKMCSLVLPFSTFNIPYVDGEEHLWKAVYTTNNPLHLTCDYPVILADPKKFLAADQRLIMPVKSSGLLFYGKDILSRELPPEFHIHVDLAIFHQAQRYVCGPNREYLNTIANMYAFYEKYDKTKLIIPEVLEFLQ